MNNKNLLKTGFWYTLCNFIVKALALISMPIFSRLMTKTDVGDFASYTTWISLFAVIITLNLQNSVVLAKLDFSEHYNEYISTVTLMGFFSTLICYLIVLPWIDTFSDLLQIPIYASHIMFIYMAFSPALDIRLAKYRSEMKSKPIVLMTIVPAIFATGISIIGVVCSENGFAARTVGHYIPLTLFCVIIFIINIADGTSFKFEYGRYALAICVPLVVHSIAGVIMSSSDRLMIKRLCSSEDVALYSVAYSCALLVNILRNSLIYAWEPWLFGKLQSKEKKIIRDTSVKIIILFSVCCMGVVLFAPEILYVLGGNDYVEAKYVVPPVVMGYLVALLYSLYGEIERYYKKQNYFAIFAVVSAATNLLLNYIFIPQYGYIAAAYTTFACFSIECLLHYIHVRKMKMSDCLNGKFNFWVVLTGWLVTVSMNVLYEYNIIRYSIIVFLIIVFVAVAVVNRNRILKIYKELKRTR